MTSAYIALLALSSGLACLALALGCFNVVTWPRRARVSAAPSARVSLLIPARDEERCIEACVRAACATGAFEVVVCDDASSDETGAILQRLCAELPILRVTMCAPLPPGFVGKPWVCARLAEVARGDVLVFVDADVWLAPTALIDLAGLAAQYGADVVTAVPRQELGSWCERLVLPLLHLTYVAWLPLPLIWRARDPRFLAANGQLLWTTPRALARIGGFHAVHAELVDDVALCRTAKRAGLRVLFADGFALARCRMYRSAREVVAGFSKNLHEGVGGTLGVLGVVALYACAFVLPWCALGTTVGVVGAGAGLVLRLVLAARFRQPVWSALLHPVGVLVLCGIALNSVRWSISGTIRWKGRVYAARATRVTS